MNKEEFILRLKDPMYAEAMQLDRIVESLAEGNTVETIPGRSLMYITVFMDKSHIYQHEKETIEYQVKGATKHWWMEGCNYDKDHSIITMGFRER